MGLDKSLDEVRDRILGTKPLPSLREAFSKVRQKESSKRVMMGRPDKTPALDGSALIPSRNNLLESTAHGSSQGSKDSRTRRGGRPWYDHCKKLGHFKDTCWKLHGKPPD